MSLDLSSLSKTDVATITIRNSSGSWVNFPQISNPATPWPYNIDLIKKQLPPTTADQDLAIATWQFVVNHTFHYCSAGTGLLPTGNFLTDPALILNSFGFGCCDQSDRVLVSIWQELGYQARLAAMTFHTVPEIFYGGTWHMLDPDHRSYYLRDDGTIASTADILADPNIIVRQASAAGTDGAGWSATLMAQLYAQNASTLVYYTSGYLTNLGLGVSLHPHESLTIFARNLAGTSQRYDSGDPFTFKSVGAGQFDWDLSFADAGWRSWTYTSSNVDVFSDAAGNKYLSPATNAYGWLGYRESSMFPVLALSVAAQMTAGNGGVMWAYFSTDGVHWSTPVQFVPSTGVSGYQMTADLSAFVQGAYTYYISIQVSTGTSLHRLRISPVVQMSRWIFPQLVAGSVNQLSYSDGSPAAQARRLQLITRIPTRNPEVRGLQAESLVPESPIYSLGRDYGAANLVDGNPATLAYPGNTHIDYVIHLGDVHTVTGVSIDWGLYGSDARYLQSWTLKGRIGGGNWQVLASGGFPGVSTVDLPLNSLATDLRIVADGTNNLGIYDVRVFGTELPSVPVSTLTVRSNVPEDPTFSLAAGYPAANLIDDNPQSLAYPSSNKIDYQVSLPSQSHLAAAVITWGSFGQDPVYIDSWSLLGRTAVDQPWVVLAQGGFPATSATAVTLDSVASDVRLVASSTQNSIGAYGLHLYGLPVPAQTNPATATIAGSTIQTVQASVTASSNAIDITTLFGYGDPLNLTDGDEASDAFPYEKSIDYTLDPGQRTYVDAVRVVWGNFGTDVGEIDSWRLLGQRDGADTWEYITGGGVPNAAETVILVKNTYRKLRIAADSSSNYVGIYEAQAFGVPQ